MTWYGDFQINSGRSNYRLDGTKSNEKTRLETKTFSSQTTLCQVNKEKKKDSGRKIPALCIHPNDQHANQPL